MFMDQANPNRPVAGFLKNLLPDVKWQPMLTVLGLLAAGCADPLKSPQAYLPPVTSDQSPVGQGNQNQTISAPVLQASATTSNSNFVCANHKIARYMVPGGTQDWHLMGGEGPADCTVGIEVDGQIKIIHTIYNLFSQGFNFTNPSEVQKAFYDAVSGTSPVRYQQKESYRGLPTNWTITVSAEGHEDYKTLDGTSRPAIQLDLSHPNYGVYLKTNFVYVDGAVILAETNLYNPRVATRSVELRLLDVFPEKAP